MKTAPGNPTQETYTELQRAYDFFNGELFGGTLSSCIITVPRQKKSHGFFWAETWVTAKGKRTTDEIALNPVDFKTRTTRQVLSTLVHEMAHLWQHRFGKSSRNGYHNRQWAAKMVELGLIPSDTGLAGGKQTGQRMTHYIDRTGAFDIACKRFLGSGFFIPWSARPTDGGLAGKKKAASKTKYTCAKCGINAWAKPDLEFACMGCKQQMQAEG